MYEGGFEVVLINFNQKSNSADCNKGGSIS